MIPLRLLDASYIIKICVATTFNQGYKKFDMKYHENKTQVANTSVIAIMSGSLSAIVISNSPFSQLISISLNKLNNP